MYTPDSRRSPKGPGNKMKERRATSAKQRIEAAAQRTPEEQLARLDAAFGKGKGAVKERAKLAARIAARDAETPAPKKTKKTK